MTVRILNFLLVLTVSTNAMASFNWSLYNCHDGFLAAYMKMLVASIVGFVFMIFAAPHIAFVILLAIGSLFYFVNLWMKNKSMPGKRRYAIHILIVVSMYLIGNAIPPAHFYMTKCN